jgi:hypothetical protein
MNLTRVNKILRFFCCFSFSFILMSCNDNAASIHKENSDKGFIVDIKLKDIAMKTFNNDNYTVVYGDISVKGVERKLSSTNLDCFSLISDGRESDSIYVDSVASFEKNKYRADQNGEIFVSVYWTFPNKNKKNIELKRTELIVKDDHGCVVFYNQ